VSKQSPPALRAGGGAIAGRRTGPRPRVFALALAVLLLLTTACATATLPPAPTAPGPATAVPGFAFATDTFDFRNDIRERNPGVEDLYANYCFVLAKGLRQFFAFARFDPSAPRLDGEGYVQRSREVLARPPWENALPPADRITIPGYGNLREFSRGEEQAVKTALGPRFWTLVHWTNWRVVFPVTRGHQAHVAQEVRQELADGRLVQLLVTNWPKPELNHTVVAYQFQDTPEGIEFAVWDPNDPSTPNLLTFDRRQERFVATSLYATDPGIIRVFRMYYSPWL
jgi:hypothetical protein